MIRILSLILASILLLGGCSETKMQPAMTSYATESYKTATNDIPTFDEYVEAKIGKFENNIREFGKRANFIDISENLTAYIVYPKTNEEFLDSAIMKWIEDTVSFYKLKNPSESFILSVSYDSCLVDKNTVSIKLYGTYSATNSNFSEDIIKTFNAKLNRKKLITIKNITKNTKKLKNKLIQKSGLSRKVANSGNILEHFYMTKDGVEIILTCKQYFPEAKGIKSFLFKYDELKFPSETSDNGKPKIALTFDDGPSAHTERLLNIFAQHGAKGTFFVLGEQFSGKENTLKRIVNEGHQIGNHTWNHRQLTKLTVQEITDELLSTANKIFDITGVDCTIMRPPYGSFDDKVKEVCKDLEFPVINWSVDTLDWEIKDAELVYEEVMNSAYEGAIILCHDIYKTTIDAMELAVPDLIAEGYELVTVSELLGDLTPGKVHRKK